MRGGLFEQKSRRAQLGHLLDVSVITVRGENEHLGVGKVFANLPGGFQPVEQRHRDVHHDHGGSKFPGQLHGLAAGFRFADHFNIRFVFQQCPETLPDDLVIFRQQDSNSFHRPSDFGVSGFQRRRFPRGPSASGICAWIGGALAGSGLDGEAAADHLHPLSHAEQSQSFVLFGVQHAFAPESPGRCLLFPCKWLPSSFRMLTSARLACAWRATLFSASWATR